MKWPEMEIISDLAPLKEALNNGNSFEGMIYPSLVLGCGPDYFAELLKKHREAHPDAQVILWLHCGSHPGDVLKAFAAGVTHIMTTVTGDVFIRLTSLADAHGVALRQVPRTPSEVQSF